MSQTFRQRRIARAEELAAQYPSASEMLRFFVPVARFQDELYRAAQKTLKSQKPVVSFAQPLAAEVVERFPGFLSLVEETGPAPVAAAARDLRNQAANRQLQLLTAFWTRDGGRVIGVGDKGDGHREFFARAFLQPYAEFVREQAGKQEAGPTPCLCPFCSRKPGVGVLRPLGDGGQRSLVCSFCLGEWEFRRIVCPGCGEENHAKLPVYTAEEFQHVRVECCDTCRRYIKTVDLTRNGLAEPVVDEIASIPLDLWAQKQGYTKLQVNLMLL
ncbi:MAG: formate dehydrogenase accessory protein FdhE [Acidobacteriia bacterium]|nr:formate dehydrogenase accessory protein FdhE [Terriglobia bacterium]